MEGVPAKLPRGGATSRGGSLQSKGLIMTKFLLAPVLALGLMFASADLNTAEAQYGYGLGATCPGTVYSSRYNSYRYGYSPYRSYYGSYYGSPGLSVSRYYGNPRYRSYAPVVVSPYGLGGYGNLGYPGIGPSIRTLPRVQLRVGF